MKRKQLTHYSAIAGMIMALLLLILAALSLSGCGLPFGDEYLTDGNQNEATDTSNGPPGVLLEEPIPAPDFRLTAHEGGQISPGDLKGQVVAVFFGYTGCPDICPMTLGYMAQATEALGADANQVEFLLVTVDPERDSPERLAQYVSRIDAPITALSGSENELEPVWDDYDILVERRDREGGGYLVDHSAQVWLIDQHGDLVMFLPMGADGDDLTGAIRWLLEREG